MLAFAIVLVFGAHPDFWMPGAEFDEKHCNAARHVSFSLNALNNVLDRMAIDDRAMEPLYNRLADKYRKEIVEYSLKLENEDRPKAMLKLLVNRKNRLVGDIPTRP